LAAFFFSSSPSARPALAQEWEDYSPNSIRQYQPSSPEKGPSDAGELESFIDGIMSIQMEDHHSAGAVVTVVKDGEVFFTKGYGYADYDNYVKVDPEHTLFRIGSVSKLFVWTSVMQLVEEGVLDLDTDVNEYLTAFQIPATYPEPITLKHIMTHSAGFEDRVVRLFGTSEADKRPLGELLAEQIPARVRPPGEVSSYSNHATAMAALIVEEVSGIPWDQFVQERILDPLGMEYFSFAQPLPEDLRENMSKGYSYGGGEFHEKDFEIVPLYPIGAASASGAAMAKFMIAHLNLGELDGRRILQEETARRMHSDLYRMAPGMDAALYGFYEMSANGERIFGHGGDTQWFHTRLALFPERDLGVFVSFNTDEGAAATGQFLDAFVDHYFPAEEEKEPAPPEDFNEWAKPFTGKFRPNRFSHTSIAKVMAMEAVNVKLTDHNTLKVFNAEWIPVDSITFMEKHGDGKLVFRVNAQGEVTHMFRASVPIVAFERIPASENPTLNLILFAVAGVMLVWTFLSWPLGWIARRWYGVDGQQLSRLPTRTRLALWLASLTFILFAVGLAITLSEPGALVEEIPVGLRVVLLFPFVAAAFTTISLWYAFRSFQKREGRLLSRLFYSGAAVSFAVLIWQLNVWNLMGWRF
jgi:CubicO group peptidase (beta-lactamase class C family)